MLDRRDGDSRRVSSTRRTRHSEQAEIVRLRPAARENQTIWRAALQIHAENRRDPLASVFEHAASPPAKLMLAFGIRKAGGLALGHRRDHLGQQRCRRVVIEIDWLHLCEAAAGEW